MERLLAGCACLLLIAACAGTGGGVAATPRPPALASPTAPSGQSPAVPITPSAVPPPPDNWATYAHDAARSAAGPQSPSPGPISQAWVVEVDQQVFAQPLLVDRHVIVATENNSVYSLDAATGAIVWMAHFGDPVRRSMLPCGTIDPTGIISTPAVDVPTGTVYAVAFLAPFHHELYALELATGAVRWHVTIDAPGSSARVHQQRGALTVSRGRVYVPFGGLNGDCGNYLGRVVGIAADGSGPLLTYAVPAQGQGGIWATGGLSQDEAGNLYAAIGNAPSTTGFDYGNAVVRLDPDLKATSYWAPADWAALNRLDADVGSLTPLQLPGGLVFQAGKAGVGYLLRTSALGGIGAEVFSGPVCPGGGSFGAAAYHAGVIYVPCRGTATVALKVSGDRFDVAWRGPGGWPPISAYGAVWALAGTSPATLVQLDPSTGSVISRTPVGTTNNFCSPSAGGGRIFVPAGSRVVAFAQPA